MGMAHTAGWTTATHPWTLRSDRVLPPAGDGHVGAAEVTAVDRSLVAIWLTRFVRALLLSFVLTGVMVVTANGQSITYVANCGDDNVSVIYTATHEILNPPVRATIPVVGQDCPTAVAFTPYRIEGNANGQSAYVANALTGTVTMIDTATSAVIGNPIQVGVNPVAIAISGVCLNPNGGACNPKNELQDTYAYVANKGSNSVSVINTDPKSAQFKNVTTITTGIGHEPTAIAVSKPILEQASNGMVLSAGFFVYVTNSGSDSVSVIDANPKSGTFNTVIRVIDLTSLGDKPMGVTFDRTSRWAYVTNFGSGNVTAIDTTSHTAKKWIPVGTNPTGIAATVDFTGSSNCMNFRAYVANTGSDSFSVLNIEPGCVGLFQTVVATTKLQAGDRPTAVSVMYPDEDFVYITLDRADGGRVSVIDSDPDSDKAQYNHEVGRVPVGGHPLGIANTPRIPYAYVANSGSSSMSVVGASPQIGDPHPVLGVIPLGFSPSWMVLHRNQDFLFVVDQATRRIYALNTISLKVVAKSAQLGVTGTVLRRVTMPPDGCCMYVTASSNKIYAIDTDETIATGPADPGFSSGVLGTVATINNPCKSPGKPAGLDVHPSNFRMYVACTESNEIVVIDTHQDLSGGGTPSSGGQNGNGGTSQVGGNGSNQGAAGGGSWNKVLGRIPLPPGTGPVGVGVTHAGNRLYVLGNNGKVTIIDTTVKGSTTQYHPIIGTVTVGTNPVSVAFNELDQYAYVTNSGSGSVSVIDVKSNAFVKNVFDPHLKNPQDIFINLGERTAAYVTNMGDGTVTLIDVQPGPTFNTVLDTVTVGTAPIGVIITEP